MAEARSSYNGQRNRWTYYNGSSITHSAGQDQSPQSLDDDTLNGIARTLSQLSRLGLLSIVVVDCNDGSQSKGGEPNWRGLATEQAARIVHAIDSYGGEGARMVDDVHWSLREKHWARNRGLFEGKAHITMRKLLMTPLRRE